MIINSNTKIAAILKENPLALDAIISISPRFEKLRNTLMRRLMAGRTSLAMASKVGGCTVKDFFEKLKPLGFEVDNETTSEPAQDKAIPAFITSLKREQIIEFDVRPILASGTDPLQQIMEKIKSIKTGQALKIINTFEPTPLILLLQKKGFETYTDELASDLFETYFFKRVEAELQQENLDTISPGDWEQLNKKYDGKTTRIDVRNLEMPQPMRQILEALEQLKDGEVLFVNHKRIPVFLLPELNDRNFDYRIKEISDGEVHLLIFRN